MGQWKFVLPPTPSQYSAKRKRSLSIEDPQSKKKNHYSLSPALDNTKPDYLWVDHYAPKTVEDVCVRGDKVKELRTAIEHSSIGSRQGHTKILLLTGQSGIGKSTLARLLCKSMDYDIVEWTNPVNDYDSTETHVHTMTLFSQFLSSAILKGSQQQIIFLDDMPDITTEGIKQQLHSLLKNIVYSSAKFLLIIIVTDAWMESSSSSFTNYDSKLNRHIDILPTELNSDLRVRQIKFNPVTRANMTKALKSILAQEGVTVQKETFDESIEKSDGDLRAAINNMQFSSLHTLISKNKLPAKKNSTEKARFDDKLGPLTLFHALGKVLYAKRNPNGTYESEPEHILAKLPVDNDMFISYLHQNYSEFFDDMDSCTRLLEYMSDADTIRSQLDWQDTHASIYRGLVSIRGVMINPPRKSITYRKQPFEKPRFYQAQLETRQHKLEKTYSEFMASVHCRAEAFRSEEQMEYQEDPVEDFSEDEFDDIYGDDDELAAFMDY
ncbi:Rad17 cell cycle checkpoint protein-domain-containing protein [Parasitella parasitica]|nr:Rad17 cell cycle checkpoint protein-domain-containing protein [Parasitella parasitica]